MVVITFPDGNTKEFDGNVTIKEIAESIGPGLAQAALAGKVNDILVDLNTTITTDTTVQIITFKDPEGQEIFNHSAAHVLAHAVTRLFPDAKLTIGPAIDEGFYYDIDIETPFSAEDLAKIESEMKKIAKEKLEFEKLDVSAEKAKEIHKDNEYKLEMIGDLGDEQVTVYKQGDFYDLCKGPHVPTTSKIKAVKLTKVAGAYWRGDAKNKQLQRIYGIAFPDKKELKKYLADLEERLKRDHTKIGKDMDLFVQSELVGKGLPLFTPKGTIMLKELRNFVETEEAKRGYLQTMTPLMSKSDLYQVSGHWDHYKEDMFVLDGSGEVVALRPMTCPHQFQIYKSKKRSYKDLPLKYSENATLFRNEESGKMLGIIRCRQFTITEGHLIVRRDQLEDEFEKVIDLIEYMLDTLGLKDYSYRLSRGDPEDKKNKYIDNPKLWAESEGILKDILDRRKMDYVEAIGEAAFYGPKLDVQYKNVHGKEDTIITIQIDFALPERFNMTYTDEHNKEVMPIVIHRTSIGCYERTLAMLIEHYAGKFPLWLNPVQVRVLTVADRFEEYANEVKEKMLEAGIRVEVDSRSESVGKKVREAQLDKINYILVVGENEVADRTVTIRTRENEVIGAKGLNEFTKELVEEIKSKK